MRNRVFRASVLCALVFAMICAPFGAQLTPAAQADSSVWQDQVQQEDEGTVVLPPDDQLPDTGADLQTVPPDRMPPTGADLQTVPPDRMPPTGADLQTVPPDRMPPTGAELQTVPPDRMPPTGAELQTVPPDRMPPTGAELQTVPPDRMPPTGADLQTVPPDRMPPTGADLQTVPPDRMPPTGADLQTVPPDQLPPTGADLQTMPPDQMPPTGAPVIPVVTRDAFPSVIKPAAPASTTGPDYLIIPSIDLETKVVPVGWEAATDSSGRAYKAWEVASYAAGWHNTSQPAGAGGNVVISGHNNVNGSVFRDVYKLREGNPIILWQGGEERMYRVESVMKLLEEDQPAEVRQENARWIGETESERLTLVTCWPNWSNTHRIVVVAEPVE